MPDKNPSGSQSDLDREIEELRRTARELDESVLRDSQLDELPSHSHPTLERRGQPRPEPTRLAPSTPASPDLPTKDFHFNVDVIEAGMAASLSLFPPTGKGKLPDTSLLIQLLKGKKIKFGIVEEEVKKALAEVASTGKPVLNRVVARGAPPDHGAHSDLQLAPVFHDLKGFQKTFPEEKISGLENVEAFEKLAKVKAGDELGKFLPANPGRGGLTVTGAPLPAKKGTASHFLGTNVVEEEIEGESRRIWKAEVEGIAVLIRGKLSVLTYSDPLIKVVFEEGDYSAVLQLIAPTGLWKAPSLESIREAVQKAGVVFGVDEAKIKSEYEAFCAERKSRVFVCAQGIRPRDGVSAEIKFHIDTSYKPVLQEDDQGRIDYRIRQNVIFVEKNQAICSLFKPKEEEKKGTTVKGKIVSGRDGKKVELKAVQGILITEISPERTDYMAGCDGEVVYDAARGEISVSQVKVVDAIDIAFGNLTFTGNVTVNKNIEDGMKVFVTGDLYVKGLILAAKVEVQGNLSCEGGIITKQTGRVDCGKDLKAKFVENSVVRVGGNALVEKSILQSRIACLGSFTANSEKSLLMGGSLQAKGGAVIRNLGSDSGAQAAVHVGSDYKALERYHEIVAGIRSRQEQALQAEVEIERLSLPPTEGKTPNESDKARIKELLLAKSKLLAEILALRNEGKALYESIEGATAAELVVTGKIFPNNTLRFGSESLTVKDAQSAVKFAQDPQTREIRSTPMKAPVARKMR